MGSLVVPHAEGCLCKGNYIVDSLAVASRLWQRWKRGNIRLREWTMNMVLTDGYFLQWNRNYYISQIIIRGIRNIAMALVFWMATILNFRAVWQN
jgi:hypothetical protein